MLKGIYCWKNILFEGILVENIGITVYRRKSLRNMLPSFSHLQKKHANSLEGGKEKGNFEIK